MYFLVAFRRIGQQQGHFSYSVEAEGAYGIALAIAEEMGPRFRRARLEVEANLDTMQVRVLSNRVEVALGPISVIEPGHDLPQTAWATVPRTTGV